MVLAGRGMGEGKSPLVNYKCTISIFDLYVVGQTREIFMVTSIFAARRRWPSRYLCLGQSAHQCPLPTPNPPRVLPRGDGLMGGGC